MCADMPAGSLALQGFEVQTEDRWALVTAVRKQQ